MKQETGEGQEVQTRQGRGESLIIAGQATKTGCPGEITLHHPALGQENKAALGLGQLDDRQLDAVLGRRCRWLLPGVALVHIRQFHVLAGDGLDPRRQLLDLRPLLLIGGCDQQRQQMPERIDRGVDLRAFAPLMS